MENTNGTTRRPAKGLRDRLKASEAPTAAGRDAEASFEPVRTADGSGTHDRARARGDGPLEGSTICTECPSLEVRPRVSRPSFPGWRGDTRTSQETATRSC